MATNYHLSKSDVEEGILDPLSLPASISNKILNSLKNKVWVAEFNSVPTGAELRGKDLAVIDIGGTVNLSGISAADIKDLDAFIFTTNNDVNFSLNGNGTKSFKGVITTNDGNDIITTNSIIGVTVSSGDGNDTVTTGSGKDSVSAGSGNDSINTGAGNDTVLTGSGNDSVNTGDGNDSVVVGSGNDSVDTGAGNDTVKLALGASGTYQFDGGAGIDNLDLSLANIATVSQAGAVVTITLNDASVITATDFGRFIYDSNGIATPDGVVIVAVAAFDAAF